MTQELTPDTRPIRCRIAPSPTGDPHVGTAYIGLLNYIFAAQLSTHLPARTASAGLASTSRARTLW